MGVKNSQMFIQTKTSPSLEIITRWAYLPISMVLRSERRLKLKMLSLARTSKHVNDTSALSIKKSWHGCTMYIYGTYHEVVNTF